MRKDFIWVVNLEKSVPDCIFGMDVQSQEGELEEILYFISDQE